LDWCFFKSDEIKEELWNNTISVGAKADSKRAV
jgi:hypothetical protein